VTVGDEPGWDWQYLVFQRDQRDPWRLLGHVDLPTQKYSYPMHQFVTVGGRSLLAVSFLGMSGTGVLLCERILFDLDGDRMALALRYPLDGNLSGWGMPAERELRCRRTKLTESGGIELDYCATLSNGLDELPEIGRLFSLRMRLVFSWDPGRRAFLRDAERSEAALEDLYDVILGGPDEILSVFRSQMEVHAMAGPAPVRRWIGLFLERCGDGPDKGVLKGILDGFPPDETED
jgi:hypothetical protein